MLRLVSSNTTRIRRRAILVCEHPEFGWVALDRRARAFQRTFLPPLDECGRKGILVDRARSALKTLYRYDFEEFERGPMFILRGLTDHVTECTAFRFGTMFDQVYRQLPDDHYLQIAEHPSAGELSHAIKSFTQSRTQKCARG